MVARAVRPRPEERACEILAPNATRVRASRRMRTRDWMRPHASRRIAARFGWWKHWRSRRAAMLLSMRAGESNLWMYKTIAREASLFPACSLQGTLQLRREWRIRSEGLDRRRGGPCRRRRRGQEQRDQGALDGGLARRRGDLRPKQIGDVEHV